MCGQGESKSGGGFTAAEWIRVSQAKIDETLPLARGRRALALLPHYILRILGAKYRCEKGASLNF